MPILLRSSRPLMLPLLLPRRHHGKKSVSIDTAMSGINVLHRLKREGPQGSHICIQTHVRRQWSTKARTLFRQPCWTNIACSSVFIYKIELFYTCHLLSPSSCRRIVHCPNILNIKYIFFILFYLFLYLNDRKSDSIIISPAVLGSMRQLNRPGARMNLAKTHSI